MEDGIKMISAVAEIFNYKKENPHAEKEEILQHISEFVSREKNMKTKLSMIAIATKTAELIERNKRLNEKETIKLMMNEIPNIRSLINENEISGQ